MNQNKFDLTTRICIVGAGAAGLSAAYNLRKKGYKNITVLEKEKQAGGKCRTIFYKDRSFELGALMLNSDYRITLQIMKDLGLKTKLVDFNYSIKLNNNGVEVKSNLSNKLKYIWQLLFNFSYLALKNRSIYKPGLSNIPEEFYETFDIFCHKNNLLNFAQTVNLICPAYGYGYFDTVPTAYYMKYLTFTDLVRSLLSKGKGISKFFVEGAGTLWQTLAMQFNVLYEENIVNIERKKQISIQTKKGKYEFDKLILACPLDNSLEFLDKSFVEEELFSKIIYNYYYTFAFIIKKFPFERKIIGGYLPENLNKENQGKIMCFYRRYLDSELCTFYLIANQKHDEQQLKSDVKNQLEKMGFIIEREYTSVKWKYFPHVSSEDMKNGFYEKLEGIQGQNNTYLTGEIMNFSSIRGVCQYSNYLINKYY